MNAADCSFGIRVARLEDALAIAGLLEELRFVTVHVTPALHRPMPVGRMRALVVATRVRGRGLGRALVATAERRLADAGCGLVEVTSNQELSEAHSFYQQLGYAMTAA